MDEKDQKLESRMNIFKAALVAGTLGVIGGALSAPGLVAAGVASLAVAGEYASMAVAALGTYVASNPALMDRLWGAGRAAVDAFMTSILRRG